MEIRIGIVDSPRELVVASAKTPQEMETLVSEALSGKMDVLSLEDTKGRRFIVPVSRIAFVEIGVDEQRKVGFSVA